MNTNGRHYWNAAPYRARWRDTGNAHDFRKAAHLMDWLFAVAGLSAMRRFSVYKDGRLVKMPAGGEVSEVAAWLETQ
jgi:hypothetical protein